jgi:putative DNA primase/helicase
MQITDFLSHLEGVHETSNGWEARCPAHEDNKASLCINHAADGKILVHCQAGCDTRKVLGAMGFKLRDLFNDNDNGRGTTTRKTAQKSRETASSPAKGATGQSSAQKAAGKEMGGRRKPWEMLIEATYEYTDEHGALLYQSLRLRDPETGKKDFAQRRKDVKNGSASWAWSINKVRRVLYRLPRVIEAAESGTPIYIVEGEKDVHTLESWGYVATTNSGGANAKWPDTCDKHLTGAELIIIPDNDKPGRKHAEDVATHLSTIAGSIRILDLPGLPEKGDVTDWAEAGHTREEFEALLTQSTEYTPVPINLDTFDPNAPYGPDGEPLNDLGNARRLVAKYGATIKHCSDAGKWFVWDGMRWRKDTNGELMRMANEIVDDMLKLVRTLLTHALDKDVFDAVKRFERHASMSGNHRRLEAMVKLAESLPGCYISAAELDADPWVLNVANGTLDLKTGKLQPHNPADNITKLAPVEYDPDATCPVWESFVSSVFQGDTNADIIPFIQRAAGYTLTGDTREQVFFILHGRGSNGKSTFVNILREIMGDYEQKTSTETLTERDNRSATNDLAALRGARFVSAIETSAGKKLAEALVKELTGEDAITARFLYQEFFSFKPSFKLWLACNHIPQIQGQDNGIWRRIRLIPFDVQFQDADHPTGPYKDRSLYTSDGSGKLQKEYPGILSWLVRGCLLWQADGLVPPSRVTAATNSTQAEMDPLGGFLSESCVIFPSAEVSAKELYAAYSGWAERSGERPLSQRWFGLRLSERGVFKKEHKRNGWYWVGLGLMDTKYAENVTYVTDDVTLENLDKPVDNSENQSQKTGSVTLVTDVTVFPVNPISARVEKTDESVNKGTNEKFTENASQGSQTSRPQNTPWWAGDSSNGETIDGKEVF